MICSPNFFRKYYIFPAERFNTKFSSHFVTTEESKTNKKGKKIFLFESLDIISALLDCYLATSILVIEKKHNVWFFSLNTTSIITMIFLTNQNPGIYVGITTEYWFCPFNYRFKSYSRAYRYAIVLYKSIRKIMSMMSGKDNLFGQ